MYIQQDCKEIQIHELTYAEQQYTVTLTAELQGLKCIYIPTCKSMGDSQSKFIHIKKVFGSNLDRDYLFLLMFLIHFPTEYTAGK